MTKQEKDLVALVQKTETGIQSLEGLAKELKNVATPQLVTGYLKVKDFSNRVTKFTEVVRQELLYGGAENAKEKVLAGRFFDDADSPEVDEKGHLYLEGAEGTCLKAEKRVSVKMNKEKASSLLKEIGVYQEAIDRKVVSVDGSALEDLENLREKVSKKTLVELEKVIAKFKVVEELNEEKIEALVVLGKIQRDQIEGLVDTSITYALTEKKRK